MVRIQSPPAKSLLRIRFATQRSTADDIGPRRGFPRHSYVFDRSIKTPRDGVIGGVLISGPYGTGPRTRAYYADE